VAAFMTGKNRASSRPDNRPAVNAFQAWSLGRSCVVEELTKEALSRLFTKISFKSPRHLQFLQASYKSLSSACSRLSCEDVSEKLAGIAEHQTRRLRLVPRRRRPLVGPIAL
jgi:hypothetical protein